MTKPKGVPKTLPIESLLLVPALQMREEENFGHILDLTDVLTANKKLPRVKVIHVSEGEHTGYYVWDGFHTTKAHAKAGKKRVPCLVQKGTWEDAVVAATGANTEHLGLKRSRADKRRAVLVMLQQFGKKWTDGKIGDHIKVSRQFVRDVRLAGRAEDPEADAEEPETKQGADGKTYTTTKKARPKPAEAAEEPAKEAEEETTPEVVALPSFRDFEGAIAPSARMVEGIVKARPAEKQSAEYAAVKRNYNQIIKTIQEWLLKLGK